MGELNFELVTPERLVRSGKAHMIVVPGTEGDFAVLVGHAPFMSTIRSGEIAIYATPDSTPERLRIEGGFAEVSEQGLAILAERLEEITTH